jgi:hypothetical protein
MPANAYDIAVAYRICPVVAKQTPIYHNDKYKLSELCLYSFKKSLGSLKAKMIVLLDNCPPEYEKLFRKYFKKDDLDIIKLEGIGNQATYNMQIDLLSKQNFSDIIYFAEDDYFYFPDKFKTMIDFLNENKDVDFISVYDHLDLYNNELHNHQNYIKVFGNHHWRTANSTCLTFLTTKSTLIRAKRTIASFSRGNHDASMWISLTKRKLNPYMALIYMFRNWDLFGIIAKAWYYCWPQILFGKRYKLWIPIPAFATHMLSKYLAPAISWQKEIAEEIKNIR